MTSIREPNCVTIDLSALARNFRRLRGLVPPAVKMMPIVKSDAYGHGMLEVSKALEECGVDFLGVANFSDAIELRRAGVRAPVAALSGLRTRDEAAAAAAGAVAPVLNDLDTARILSEECTGAGLECEYFVKVDTGMGRLGIPCEEVVPFMEIAGMLPRIKFLGIMSHLSTADESDEDFALLQIRRFEKAVERLRSIGVRGPLNSLSNSAALCRYRQADHGMVRTGIMLYGAKPAEGFRPPVDLEPVMSFRTEVVQVRDVREDAPVSYGRTYYTGGPRRLAVLSAGYGEGIPRSMSNRGRVLLSGRRVPQVGTICMDLTICDITGIENVKPGDEAVFIGSQGDSAITADEMARWSGCISYEILCSIGQRNKRTYLR